VYAAIETSFDETGIALCTAEGNIAHSLLASQIERHKPYGGCVPELAARTHLSDLPQMWQQLPAELVAKITHLGVTSGPGLPGCLLAGVNFARGVARALKVPLYGLNHLSGHVFSPFMPAADDGGPGLAPGEIPYPHLALLISGGHTELFLVRSLTELELLGQTRDDAVGELLDKVSAMLGYGYPGGAVLEQVTRRYSGITADARYEGKFSLPLPMRDSDDLNFSYSGLKTAVLRTIRGGNLAGDAVITQEDHPALLAALFASVAESLWIKVAAALGQHSLELVTLSGGVAVNGFIRAKFAAEAARLGVGLRFPQPRHCLDNAEMLAWLLRLYVMAGLEPEPFDADSNWNPGVPR